MPRFEELDTPALLLDAAQVERNIARYQDRARAAGIGLRPHAKAHKCVEVGRMQMRAGAAGLCCAKLAEAEALAALGDLMITTPVVGALKIRRLMLLCARARITVVVDDAANVAELSAAARQAGASLEVLVDIDVGQGRTGVPPGRAAGELAAQVRSSPGLRLRGVQAYHGRLQGVASLEERGAMVRQAMAKLDASLFDGCEVRSGGGSGSFPIDVELKALTELQPGSYVTMDSNYARVSMGGDEPHPLGHPLTLLAAVVSRPAADRAVVDVGWKSASCDSGTPLVKDRPGLAFEFAGDEHGIVRSTGAPLVLKPGEKLELIPSHCDTTVNLYDAFTVHRSGTPEASWPIVGRGKSQ